MNRDKFTLATNRNEQIDLVYDVICGIGSIGDRESVSILSEYISREDIARELDSSWEAVN